MATSATSAPSMLTAEKSARASARSTTSTTSPKAAAALSATFLVPPVGLNTISMQRMALLSLFCKTPSRGILLAIMIEAAHAAPRTQSPHRTLQFL